MECTLALSPGRVRAITTAAPVFEGDSRRGLTNRDFYSRATLSDSWAWAGQAATRRCHSALALKDAATPRTHASRPTLPTPSSPRAHELHRPLGLARSPALLHDLNTLPPCFCIIDAALTLSLLYVTSHFRGAGLFFFSTLSLSRPRRALERRCCFALAPRARRPSITSRTSERRSGNTGIMGQQGSQLLSEIEQTSNFNTKEIQRLKKRFMKLDRDGSGSIDKDEFLQIPQIANNPLALRLIAIFDEDGGGTVDFQEFVAGLSAFSNQGSREEKLRFAFKVYDMDRDGLISNGELFLVLKMMVGNNLKDQQLQQIVDKTIMEADTNGDGKLDFEEFQAMVANTDVAKQLTLEDLF